MWLNETLRVVLAFYVVSSLIGVGLLAYVIRFSSSRGGVARSLKHSFRHQRVNEDAETVRQLEQRINELLVLNAKQQAKMRTLSYRLVVNSYASARSQAGDAVDFAHSDKFAQRGRSYKLPPAVTVTKGSFDPRPYRDHEKVAPILKSREARNAVGRGEIESDLIQAAM